MRRFLSAPVDIASLAAFRALYGVVMGVAMVRFLLSGWLDKLYVEPTFFFKYWGFDWVTVPSRGVLYALVGALAVLAFAVALGCFTRTSASLFFVGFSYLELLDVTNYLNHYYLAALLALLLVVVPSHRAFSIDAWRDPSLRRDHAPAWALWLLRLQVAVVYVFAGLAKLNADWLLAGRPLAIWLPAHSELLAAPWIALVGSWAAFLYDSTIVLWLSWRRTRVLAYLAVLAFHAGTHLFFNIGIFPFLMTAAATIFFAPDWPRRWLRRPATVAPTPSKLPRLGLALLALYAVVQVGLPLRHYLYPGDVAWNEEGMRFSWKVLLREKHGSVTFHVELPGGKRVQIPPARYLDDRQEREMAGQPDLILQLAHHIAAEYRARGVVVKVFAETRVSWNGRQGAPLVDPTRDLAAVDDGLGAKDWVLPAPAPLEGLVARW